MGSNTEKKQWTNLQNLYKNCSKGIKSDNLMQQKNAAFISLYDSFGLDFIAVGENIIATTKIQNNYGAIQSFIFPIL